MDTAFLQVFLSLLETEIIFERILYMYRLIYGYTMCIYLFLYIIHNIHTFCMYMYIHIYTLSYSSHPCKLNYFVSSGAFCEKLQEILA